MDKFGIIAYASNNIGDEIQTLAQMRFLPQVDYECVRERIKDFKSDNNEKVKLIMNAWYMFNQSFFPPPETITPLLISMHFTDKMIKNYFNKPEIRKWLIKNGPVGARDVFTYTRLQEIEIPSYFSGCLTLSLLPNEKLKANKNHKYALAVNLTEEEVNILKNKTNLPVYNFGKMLFGMSMENRLRLAKCVLSLYHNAEVVVTRNLHTSLPCLAFGTPVLLLTTGKDGTPLVNRFDGLHHLCNNMTHEEFIYDLKHYNIDNPPPNPHIYKEMATKLVTTCSEFTGYDSKKSPLEDDFEPLFELISLMQLDKHQIQRNLYYANTEQLFRALVDKKYSLNSKYRIINDNQINIIK